MVAPAPSERGDAEVVPDPPERGDEERMEVELR